MRNDELHIAVRLRNNYTNAYKYKYKIQNNTNPVSMSALETDAAMPGGNIDNDCPQGQSCT
eukprot:CAMPEP_0174289764 /NCGR_PEP_ID=MMETSP0809-20121228/26237_1 /TAXON_ID=73025 ORGANISM="Eutreptiella gymnastica-like, Strain CCMP1594" /NCGR_SAMPLE_ID=MMETSP0809 /ASSEMBLY_ACC=CAM_ASM_000658 /LENGTH=60 /DNA_ID=CAMNT_0015387911 /DNA_START=45 /DNA_END=227 /DNA_ORIENTATION=+